MLAWLSASGLVRSGPVRVGVVEFGTKAAVYPCHLFRLLASVAESRGSEHISWQALFLCFCFFFLLLNRIAMDSIRRGLLLLT